MENDVPTTKIYKGEMLDVWEDLESVHLGFDCCTVHFPKECWEKIKADFRKILTDTPPTDNIGTKCGRRF